MRSATMVALALMLVLPGPVMAASAAKSAPGSTELVNLELKDMPVRQAIDMLFEGRGLKFYVHPGITGKIVEMKLKGVPFGEALGALGDAAGFAYTIKDDVYVITPKQKSAIMAAAPKQEEHPPFKSNEYEDNVIGGVGASAGPTNAVVINNEQGGPVYYGQSAPEPYYGSGYWGSPVYQVGNTQIIPGYGGPIVIAGGSPYVFGRFIGPPPPPGWVSPDVERFLRFEWAVPTRPRFIAPYQYY